MDRRVHHEYISLCTYYVAVKVLHFVNHAGYWFHDVIVRKHDNAVSFQSMMSIITLFHFVSFHVESVFIYTDLLCISTCRNYIALHHHQVIFVRAYLILSGACLASLLCS